MKHPTRFAIFTAFTLGMSSLGFSQTPAKKNGEIHRIANAAAPGTALAVRVPDGPLLFTPQVFPTDLAADARGQAGEAISRLGALLARRAGGLERVARLNAYVADERDTTAVEAAIADRFSGAPPAVTLVCSPLATKGARVAFDAVAVVSEGRATVAISDEGGVLPAGPKVFLSGIPERGADMPTSVQATMKALFEITAHLGLTQRDVVQLKAFLQPFDQHEVVRSEIARAFAGGEVPPIVLVEWVSASPVEIEMVVAGGGLKHPVQGALGFPEIPGRPANPRYSHAVTVAAGTPLIFAGGIDAGQSAAPREQWKLIFERLGSALFEVDSSFRQLVKATYYMSDTTARGTLNEIRAVYFDPARPPAASAIRVQSVGRRERAFLVDMIAVPHPGPK